MKFLWSSPWGNRIVFSDEYNSEYINKKAELKSGLGKRLTLSDSPNQDFIKLVNEHGDGLKITSDADTYSPAQSTELNTLGPQKYICRESQIDMIVHDGRDFNLINNSTGAKRPLTGLTSVEEKLETISTALSALEDPEVEAERRSS